MANEPQATQPVEPEQIEVRPASTAKLQVQDYFGFNNFVDAAPHDVPPSDRTRINMAARGRVIE